jgi:acetyl-CoA carboxylase carboxyl transferase subunit beta
MGIFSLNRKKYATLTIAVPEEEKVEVKEKKEEIVPADGLWIKCPKCQEITYKNDIENNLQKCPNCDYYYGMDATQRINLLIDDGTFEEYDSNLISEDPLNFPQYREKLKNSQEKTGLMDGVISGIGKINGIDVSIAAMDFNFMGGSMGSVLGEKITRTIERGIEFGIPVIVVASSGGARMHEGILSLMQMAKTSMALEKLREAGQLFISVPVNPTTGGVTASFAMLGDIIVTEPKAMIGFAGARVIEQTIKQKLPEGFQTSEFLQECGMIDVITKREDMKVTLYNILDNIVEKKS